MATWKIAQLCSRSLIEPSGADDAVGEIALGRLDLGKAADAVLDRRVGRHAIGQLVSDAVAELAAARGEDLLDELIPTDRHDGRQQATREGVVGGREEVLGIGRDVVQMARPADAVLDRLAAHEMGVLEGSELLQHPRPAGAEAVGELVRRARAVHAAAGRAGRVAGRTSRHRRVVGGGGSGRPGRRAPWARTSAEG